MGSENSLLFDAVHPVPWDLASQYLRRVPQYAAVEHIGLSRVYVSSVMPLCRHVVRGRLSVAEAIARIMGEAGLELYVPLLVHSCHDYRWRLIMPPVLEKHRGRLIVVDGMHRMWYAFVNKIPSVWIACVEQPPLPLPARPISWDDVSETDVRHGKEQTMVDFDPQVFRPVSRLLNSALMVVGSEVAESIVGGRE